MEDADSMRPDSVDVSILKNGAEFAKITLNKAGGWKYDYKGLPVKDKDGTPFVYTVKAADVPDSYEASVNGYEVTYTHVPEDEKYLNSQAELHDMIVGLLGGRAAEEIVFDTVTTGASNDIEKATSIARSMVTRYGMSKKFGLMGLETVESQYLDGRSAMNCADNTASEVDAEVMQILKEAYEEALGLLRENREIMDQIAAHLIEKETITGKEFMKIFREQKDCRSLTRRKRLAQRK